MNITEALAISKEQDVAVTRKSWNMGRSIRVVLIQDWPSTQAGMVLHSPRFGAGWDPFTAHSSDLLADDWQVVEA